MQKAALVLSMIGLGLSGCGAQKGPNVGGLCSASLPAPAATWKKIKLADLSGIQKNSIYSLTQIEVQSTLTTPKKLSYSGAIHVAVVNRGADRNELNVDVKCKNEWDLAVGGRGYFSPTIQAADQFTSDLKVSRTLSLYIATGTHALTEQTFSAPDAEKLMGKQYTAADEKLDYPVRDGYEIYQVTDDEIEIRTQWHLGRSSADKNEERWTVAARYRIEAASALVAPKSPAKKALTAPADAVSVTSTPLKNADSSVSAVQVINNTSAMLVEPVRETPVKLARPINAVDNVSTAACKFEHTAKALSNSTAVAVWQVTFADGTQATYDDRVTADSKIRCENFGARLPTQEEVKALRGCFTDVAEFNKAFATEGFSLRTQNDGVYDLRNSMVARYNESLPEHSTFICRY